MSKINKIIIKLFCPIKVGDYCEWLDVNGDPVWGEYRRIVWVERAEGTLSFFAFTNGSLTGIPVDRLKKEKKSRKYPLTNEKSAV